MLRRLNQKWQDNHYFFIEKVTGKLLA